MIRINQVRMKMYIGMAIGFAVGLVLLIISIVIGIMNVNSYKEGGKKYEESMTQIAVLKKDVIMGQTISKEMLTYLKVNANIVDQGKLITEGNKREIIGKAAKYNIPKGVPLSKDMYTDEITTNQDTRALELNTILLPSDINEKDYVDIRIMYPNGEDYIVASQKVVKKIANETMWIDASEEEILTLNSAVVDSYLTEGSKLYAIKYADPKTQIKANIVPKKGTNQTSDQEIEIDTSEAKLRAEVSDSIYDIVGQIRNSSDKIIVDKIFELAKEYRNYVVGAEKTLVNYQPNEDIINQMKTNSAILENATKRLNIDLRGSLEQRLKTYKINNEDDIGRVVSGAETSITTQKDLRKTILDEMKEAPTTVPVPDNTTSETTSKK